jgi:hypothetical protein
MAAAEIVFRPDAFDLSGFPRDDAVLIRNVLVIAATLRTPEKFFTHWNCLDSELSYCIQLRIPETVPIGAKDMRILSACNEVRIDDVFVELCKNQDGANSMRLNIRIIKSTVEIPIVEERILRIIEAVVVKNDSRKRQRER